MMANLSEDVEPLWIGKQKYNKDFPIYKFVVEKTVHTINHDKLAKREEWQRYKLNTSNEHEFAEKLLSGKNNKREWLHEYANL